MANREECQQTYRRMDDNELVRLLEHNRKSAAYWERYTESIREQTLMVEAELRYRGASAEKPKRTAREQLIDAAQDLKDAIRSRFPTPPRITEAIYKLADAIIREKERDDD